MNKEKVLHGLNSCTMIAGVPDICGFTECSYRNDGPMCQHNLLRDIAELQMLYTEPEKVEGMRYAYGHTDVIGDCPACGLTVYKRINTCYCGACGKRIKWE